MTPATCRSRRAGNRRICAGFSWGIRGWQYRRVHRKGWLALRHPPPDLPLRAIGQCAPGPFARAVTNPPPRLLIGMHGIRLFIADFGGDHKGFSSRNEQLRTITGPYPHPTTNLARLPATSILATAPALKARQSISHAVAEDHATVGLYRDPGAQPPASPGSASRSLRDSGWSACRALNAWSALCAPLRSRSLRDSTPAW